MVSVTHDSFGVFSRNLETREHCLFYDKNFSVTVTEVKWGELDVQLGTDDKKNNSATLN